jgi:hypothetical protein
MTPIFTPFIWVAITLPTLILLQRWIHRHLHGISLLLTGNANWAVVIYALFLLPGVILHEGSHYLTARLLGVRTGKLSIIPQRKKDGTIQLGYVEYYKNNVGPVRESLIGGAPLVFGTLVIFLIGYRIFDTEAITSTIRSGGIENLTAALSKLFNTSDFLVWLYLIFSVSNAMLPSPSDRRAWPAFFGLLALLLIILIAVGLQSVLIDGLMGPIGQLFGYLGVAFSLAIGVDLVFMAIIGISEYVLMRVKQVELVYGQGDGLGQQKI